MGNPRSQKNKPHKTRFSSKSSRHAHKQHTTASQPPIRSHQNHVNQNARAARLHRTKLVRDQKRSILLAEKRQVGKGSPAPLILALVSLTSNTNLKKARKLLLEQIKASDDKSTNAMDFEGAVEEDNEAKITTYVCPQHKLRMTVVQACQGGLQECLTIAKVADAIAFVTTLTSEKDGYLDKEGKLCLSMLRAQGLPTAFGMVLDHGDVPAKKKSDAKKSCVNVLGEELPENSKIFMSSTPKDCEQILRYLSSHRVLAPQWRNQHSFMFAQKLGFKPDSLTPEIGTLLFSGYVRGRSLSVNQLVNLSGVGDFQLERIDVLEDPFPCRQDRTPDEHQMEIEGSTGVIVSSYYPDASLQEPLIIENIPDTLAYEQTWPTEEELAKVKEGNSQKKRRRCLPKGTSEYQAAWILDESEDEVDDGDDVSHMEVEDVQVEESEQDDARNLLSEDGLLEDDAYDRHSQMMVDDEQNEERRLAELEELKAAHAADEEFPDEVDTPLDVPACQRFAKYRGLKSMRTSPWDPKESLPAEYGRIFCFENFVRTQKHVLAKAKEFDEEKVEGCVGVGSYVTLHLRNVPAKVYLNSSYREVPFVMCGLLQHESKMSVLHFSIRKHDSYNEPLKSKESFIFHAGFRVYKTKPIFSTDDINMDKHKFEKFLHPGRFCIASIFAPVSFPPLPLVMLKETGVGKAVTFAASGSLKSVDPDRIILKKIVLSGYPHRVQKQRAVVKFMFHNPEDVRWFKPVELWTKYGRRGRIKEPMGTHGSMKCIFDGVLQQRDTVCVSLYKRVYPKWPA